MKVLKKYRIYFLIGAALIALASLILLLTTPGVMLNGHQSGLSLRVYFPGTISLFGGDGTMLAKNNGMNIESNFAAAFGKPAFPSPLGILSFLGMLAILALYGVSIWFEIKKKANKSHYILGILVVTLFTAGFIIANPFVFEAVNKDIIQKPDYLNISLAAGWIVSLALLLLSSIAIFVVYRLTKDVEVATTSIETTDDFSVTANYVTKTIDFDKEERILKLLQKYKSLLDEGAITQEEYDKKKSDLLG